MTTAKLRILVGAIFVAGGLAMIGGPIGAYAHVPLQSGDFGAWADANASSSSAGEDNSTPGFTSEGTTDGRTCDHQSAFVGPSATASVCRNGHGWTLSATTSSSGSSGDAEGQAQFYETYTVDSGTSGLATGTPVPLVIHVQGSGAISGSPWAEYELDTKFITFTATGTVFGRNQALFYVHSDGSTTYDQDFEVANLGVGNSAALDPFIFVQSSTQAPNPSSTLNVNVTVCSPISGIVITGSAGSTCSLTSVPPVVTVPSSPLVAEATGPDGASVAFQASATNSAGNALPVTCSPPSGSIFQLGSTTVTCTATDAGGNSGSASFNVLVQDTTPPHIFVPSAITVNATSPAGARVSYLVLATDLVDGLVPVTCLPSSGTIFAIGTTGVRCIAWDSRDNTAQASFNVHVKGADEQITDLLRLVMQEQLGTGASLADKLQAIQADIAGNLTSDACGTLQAFINEVQAQNGKKLTSDQSAQLISSASRIAAVLGC
jgi:hypothetical protein